MLKKKFLSAAIFTLASATAFARVKSDEQAEGLGTGVVAMLAMFAVIVVIALMLYRLMRGMYRDMYGVARRPEKAATAWDSISRKMAEAVPVEEEEEILLDHEYDGIRELDNNLPVWWKYMFYGTIVFAVAYIFHYHILGTGDLQLAEYDKSVKKGNAEVAEYLKKKGDIVDENSVVALTDPAAIAEGKAIFKQNCVACHGPDAQGTVIAPNLTDDYWKNGGGVKNVFKIIKYGNDKGMKSWKDEIKPKQIQQIASYILSARGSNPPNAKAPEGDLWNEGGTAPAGKTDTTQTGK